MTTRTTLVLGGTGKTGRRVAQRLAQRGQCVRIGSRSGRPAFDWDDASTWAPTLRGVDAVYVSYQPDLALPGAAETVAAFAELSVRSGARRLVLLSGRNEEGAQRGEQAVRDSGAAWTIVRSSFFNQNFSESFMVESLLGGAVEFPAGSVTEPFIDADDIADVAAAALLDDRHVGQLYEVTGPRLLTFGEAIGEIATAAGRTISYQAVSPQQYAASLTAQGLPPDFATALTDLFTTVLDGRSSYVADGVQRALGRPPRDFGAWAREAAASGAWSRRASTG